MLLLYNQRLESVLYKGREMHGISLKIRQKLRIVTPQKILCKWFIRGIKGCSIQLSEMSLNSHWKGQRQLELSVITGGCVNGSDHLGKSFDIIC